LKIYYHLFVHPIIILRGMYPFYNEN
jgi:hypothetical protein